MKISEYDILNKELSLKEMPYSIPDGYFDGTKTRLKMIPKEHTAPARRTTIKSFLLYTATAAAIAFLLTAGGFFFGRITETETRHIVAKVNTMTNEDIIEYLIYTDTELEDLEQY